MAVSSLTGVEVTFGTRTRSTTSLVIGSGTGGNPPPTTGQLWPRSN